MKFNIHISQKQALELGISNINQAIIFDFLTGVAVWADTEIVNDVVYYWVARQTIANELPILNLKPDTIYRHLKSLAEISLIDHIKVGKKDCIRITDKGKAYYVGNESELVEKLGNESEKDSDLNPTYHTTNNNQSLSYRELPPEINKLAFDEWLEFRKSEKKKLNPISIEKLITKFSKYTKHEQQEAVNHSIENSYTGLFFDKFKGGNNGTRRNQTISGQLTGAAKQSADFHEDLKEFAATGHIKTVQQNAGDIHTQVDKLISNW